MTETVLLPSPPRTRHPKWIGVRAPSGENYGRLKGLMGGLALPTVCEESLCPHIGEFCGAGAATIRVLGDPWMRSCRFWAVKTGNPHGIVNKQEPVRVAKFACHRPILAADPSQ